MKNLQMATFWVMHGVMVLGVLPSFSSVEARADMSTCNSTKGTLDGQKFSGGVHTSCAGQPPGSESVCISSECASDCATAADTAARCNQYPPSLKMVCYNINNMETTAYNAACEAACIGGIFVSKDPTMTVLQVEQYCQSQ